MVLKNALLLAGVAVADKAKSDLTNAYVEKAFPVIVEVLPAYL